MQNTTFAQLSHSISAERLAPYRQTGDSDADVLTRYLWNICLSEALYPTLQNLEIALRNSIYCAVRGATANADWLNSNSPLLANELIKVQEAESSLRRQGKSIAPGRLIAELSFGFWTSLLGSNYEQIFWPRLLHKAFPNLPASPHRRHHVARRFTVIRHLRNRISHHEPIWNRQNLAQEHSDLMGAVAWLNLTLSDMAKITDRFPIVHTQACYLQIQNEIDQQL